MQTGSPVAARQKGGPYDAEALQSQKAREDAAKQRIFAILPEEQAQELIAIFDEFEEYETAESKFAHAMDNI